MSLEQSKEPNGMPRKKRRARKMSDRELEAILLSAKVPEPPEDYWDRFPRMVLQRIFSGPKKPPEGP